jgi:hypothetical protein
MGSYSGDGVRVVRDGGAGTVVRILLVAAAAVALATALLVVLIRRAPAPAPELVGETGPLTAAPAAQPAAPAAEPAPRRQAADPQAEPVVRAVDRLRARRRAEAAAAETGKQPEVGAREVIEYLRARGDRSGIAAFEPPGTDPPKPGIIVPEDFPLPEGFVRHYQSDDDGNALPPILMFHPDYEFVDESGAPVALPEDRVVPAELAPSGLPIRMLDVPKAPAHPAPAP